MGAIIFVVVLFSVIFNHLVESHSPKCWKAPAKERNIKNPIPDYPESRDRGQKIYEDKCGACHGSRRDGQTEIGKSPNHPAPDLSDRDMMKEMTNGEVFWKINVGKEPVPFYLFLGVFKLLMADESEKDSAKKRFLFLGI